MTWLEPCPDSLLAGLHDEVPGPEARLEAAEAISIAFVTALQFLPPRQRAVLVLRDVLGFHASEAAGMLDTTEESVTSALKRARATVQRSAAAETQPPPLPGSAAERELVGRLSRAYEFGEIADLIALLTDDVLLTMPPIPLYYQGRDLVARFLAAFVFQPGNRFRLVPTRANGQPALGMYLRGPDDAHYRANGVMVFTLAGRGVCALTRFDTGVLDLFGLPDVLAE